MAGTTLLQEAYDHGLAVISIFLAILAPGLTLALGTRTARRCSWLRVLNVLMIATAVVLVLLAAHWKGLPVLKFTVLYPYYPHSTVFLVILSAAISSAVALFPAYHDHANSQTEARFQTLAEAIPQIIWIADAAGKTTYINKRWYKMTGMDEASGLNNWIDAVHPNDRGLCHEKFQQSLKSGQEFEIEYRLHDAANGYRWYLDRAVPLKDGKGNILQWFGTCTDIEEQKLYQQNLEKQIKERTEELAETNLRLQQEMAEKDLARRELDEQHDTMMRTLRERSDRATLLAKMGELLQSCVTREEVFSAALGFAPKIFPRRRGALALFNASRSSLEIAGQWHDCVLPAQSFEPESCWALRTGQPHLVLEADKTAPCAHAIGVASSYLCVPILAQGEALGVLHIQATEEQPELGEAEMSFKTTFAAQVGLSVANIRLRDALRAQSTKDPLTGLYNRRSLTEMLQREIRRAGRAELPLCLLMLDLDHFKRFNDTYGHDAGDTVLRETASLLVRSIRAEDFVCRYGGEEFVIVLPTADLRAAGLRAEDIRSRIRDLVVMHHGHSLGLVTASIGVAAFPQHGATERELLQAADSALYQAKKDGRDRVVLTDTSPASDPASLRAASSN